VNAFEISIPVPRDDGWYDELKEFCMGETLQVLSDSVYPGIGRKILDRFVSTPLSMENCSGNTERGTDSPLRVRKM
jgi:hypothetical protein